jgi:predicted RNA binding protein YcfA (HicA-like mRNA interferase family)
MSKRLPMLSAREVLHALLRAGFVQSRVSGSHCRLIHKSDPSRKTTIPLHSGDLPRGTLRDILKQVGLTEGEFLELL